MARVLLAVMFAALALGSALVFMTIDATSHSASDTLRPLLITVGPLWLAAIMAARIVLRGGRASR
jgi:hypothetical protein